MKYTPTAAPRAEAASPQPRANPGETAPAGSVPLPPLKGVRAVRWSMPRRKSLHSLSVLTATCRATRPTRASRVASQEKPSS